VPNPSGREPGRFRAAADDNIDFTFSPDAASPNIPERGLGCEVDASCDWKLLDKWRIGMVFGYWQPGKCFNYACIDKSVQAWQVGNAGNLFGTRPDRSLNGVIGGEFSSTQEL